MIDYRPRPDFIQETGIKPAQTDLGYGSWMRNHIDAGEALFSFRSDQGEDMRMTVGLLVTVFETYISGQGMMADMRFIQGESLPAWLAFAPAGELDIMLSEQMRQSIEINPSWQSEVLKHRRAIDGNTSQTMAEIGNINRDTNNYISNLNQKSFEDRAAAMERGSQQFSDMMLERDNWRDTDGSQLNAPMGGDNTWRLDDGSYVSTDDHNFNPLESTGQFGTQLERWN
ncbi:hypothetical protein [Ruegeria sp. ANG-R]|uniref:hypothetical protein n=1 Tax=Ruegeria sp. ANG-R TaxID=1577903 RepID=UPI00126A4875|nr:hypothetical protein [Ruegeria sp. ANG-R]